MAAEFSMPVRVYIEDTDAGGIVYYVNYLKYFERARTECLRALGFHKAALIDEALMFVVTHVDTRYREPAHLDDELEVSAAITGLGAATVRFAQQVRCRGRVLVAGAVEIACVDRDSGRPRRLPEPLRRALVPITSAATPET